MPICTNISLASFSPLGASWVLIYWLRYTHFDPILEVFPNSSFLSFFQINTLIAFHFFERCIYNPRLYISILLTQHFSLSLHRKLRSFCVKNKNLAAVFDQLQLQSLLSNSIQHNLSMKDKADTVVAVSLLHSLPLLLQLLPFVCMIQYFVSFTLMYRKPSLVRLLKKTKMNRSWPNYSPTFITLERRNTLESRMLSRRRN